LAAGCSTISGSRQEFSKHSRSAEACVAINVADAANTMVMRRDMMLPDFSSHVAASGFAFRNPRWPRGQH
jgi:hypothetical protein